MGYTILQASYFMEIWLTPMLGFDYPKGAVRIYGDGSRAVSWVSYRDVARIAVAALDQVAARNTTLNVGGPEALSPLEVVRIEAAGAAEFEITHVPEAELRAQWEAATDPIAEVLRRADAAVRPRRRHGPDPRTGGVPRAAQIGAR